MDPARAGESALLAEIGVHACNLATFIAGTHAETVYSTAKARRVARMPGAHPEGYIEASTDYYRDAATLITAHRAGAAADGTLTSLVPDIRDGEPGFAQVVVLAGT